MIKFNIFKVYFIYENLMPHMLDERIKMMNNSKKLKL